MAQSKMTVEQLNSHDRINQLWNKLARARVTHFTAKNAEEFQSVGMKCRECLLALVKSVSTPEMISKGQESPQLGNFVLWCELIAQFAAPGGENERLRSYLKDVSKSTWQLVNWLTHSHSADRFGGSMAIGATENVLESFITALAKYESLQKQKRRGSRKSNNKAQAR